MLVSVVIPCYNSEKYISETIKSVLNQTYKEIEILCIDNNSTDTTLQILKTFELENDNVRLFSEQKPGANFARNKGILESNGVYLQFLDSDDVILENKIQNQVNFLKKKNLDIVVSDREVYDSLLTNKIESYTFSEIEINPINTCISRIIITGNPLYKKNIVVENGAFLERLKSAQDWEFNIRLFLTNPKIGYLQGFYLKSRSLSNSLSSDYIEVSHNACEVLTIHKNKLVEKCVYEDIQVLSKILFTYLISFINSNKNKEQYREEFLFWYKLGDGKKVFSRLNKIIISLIGIKLFLDLKNK